MVGRFSGYLKREELLGVAQLIELAQLLAKAECRPIDLVTDAQPSRASPLPQGFVVVREC